jgi:Ca2+-binding RTX toxin-like protein
VIDPDFEGLDTALVPATAPAGCKSGYDPMTRLLTLALDAEIFGAHLSVEDGQLVVNDKPCTHDGKALEVEQLDRIKITGGAEDNVVILDSSQGDFGESLFMGEAGFYMDLAGGTDHLLVRGSRGDDAYYVGSDAQRLILALTSMARINVWAKGVERFTASLGPGDDLLVPIQRLNVGLYDVDSGSVLQAQVLNVASELWGGDGHDEIVGSNQDDFISGGAGNDKLDGLLGNDFFDEGLNANGSDVINGGEGLDEVSYRFRSRDVSVHLCHAESAVGCASEQCDCLAENGEEEEGDVLVNFEIVRTGSGNDLLVGSDGDDYLYGGDGDDTLLGGAGSDVLQGGPGMDILDGGADEDICDGDENDIVISCEI